MSAWARGLRVAAALRRFPGAGAPELARFRDAALRELVRHAARRVPFYRERLARAGIAPESVRGVEDLEGLPVTEKRELRAAGAGGVVAEGLDPERLLHVTTSGSSGEPFTIRRTWLEQRFLYVFRLRAHARLGRRARDRVALIERPRRASPRDRKLVGRALRALGIGPRRLLSLHEAPERLAAELAAFDAQLVASSPSVLARVADAAAEAACGPPPSLRFALSGSEVLTPALRRRIREGLGAPVYDTYASHELDLLAWECPESGLLHTCDDALVVEVLRDGRPAAPGERGELVATGLHTWAMPFLRYRLGDLVRRPREPCPCGSAFGTLEAVQGRMLDFFRLPDGRLVHPYELLDDLARDGERWVDRYQLEQEREDRVVLRLVPTAATRPERIEAFERAARKVLGPGVSVRVELVEAIPDEPSGKFRTARSRVRSEYDGIDWERVGAPDGRSRR